MGKVNLDQLLRNNSYDHAIICTYAFDHEYFEEYCLNNYKSLINNNLTVITDKKIYQEITTKPGNKRPKQANIRYLLHSIDVKGVFHSKLILLLSKNRGRLIIGSANFTRPGITTNAELVNYYDFEVDKLETYRYLFLDALKYAIEISNRWYSKTLESNLNEILGEVSWLNIDGSIDRPDEVNLLNNLDSSLWTQIISKIKNPVESISILSRYFDPLPLILDDIYADIKPQKIKIYTQNGITTLTKDWLNHELYKSNILEIYLCQYSDKDRSQNLHAKAIVIEQKEDYLLVFGSANFTSPAIMKSIEDGNVELYLAIDGISKKLVKASDIIDPDNTAILLNNPKMLNTYSQEKKPVLSIHSITLFEVELLIENLELIISSEVPEEIKVSDLFLQIIYEDDQTKKFAIIRNGPKQFKSKILTTDVHRIVNASTIALIVGKNDKNDVITSNSVFILSLQDIDTGKNIRRERFIKEALQSPELFNRVLNELEGDEQALLLFLTYCDIPTNVLRPSQRHKFRPAWYGVQEMRKLGERNMTIFTNLHTATVNFFDRHYSRLYTIIEYGGINSITNFMHILLSAASVLRSQFERGLDGLEAKSSSLSVDEWYEVRRNYETYYDKFKSLLLCLGMDYLPKLKDYDSEDVRDRLNMDIQQLKGLTDSILKYHSDLEELRKSKLKIRKRDGTFISPNYFTEKILPEANWQRYEYEILTLQRRIESIGLS